jgi:hypothetical protein
LDIQQKIAPLVASYWLGWIELVLCGLIMVKAPGDVTHGRSAPILDVN